MSFKNAELIAWLRTSFLLFYKERTVMNIKKEETKEKVVHRQRDRTISKKGDSTIKKFGRKSKSTLGVGAAMGADKVS